MVSYGVVRDTLIHPCPTSLAEPDGFPAFHVTVYYPISRSKYFRVLLQLFGPPLKWWTFNIIYGVQLLGSIWIPPPVQSSTGVFTTPSNVSSNYRIWCGNWFYLDNIQHFSSREINCNSFFIEIYTRVDLRGLISWEFSSKVDQLVGVELIS